MKKVPKEFICSSTKKKKKYPVNSRGVTIHSPREKKKKERKKERKKKAENTSMKTCRGSKHSFCLFI